MLPAALPRRSLASRRAPPSTLCASSATTAPARRPASYAASRVSWNTEVRRATHDPVSSSKYFTTEACVAFIHTFNFGFSGIILHCVELRWYLRYNYRIALNWCGALAYVTAPRSSAVSASYSTSHAASYPASHQHRIWRLTPCGEPPKC